MSGYHIPIRSYLLGWCPVYWHQNTSQAYAEQRLNQGSSVNVDGLFCVFKKYPINDFVNDEGGDQNVNPVVLRWLGDSSRAFNDAYALTELIQWVWRSRVRRGEPITLYLPSPRMRRLFEEWLYNDKSNNSQSL